jgi:hypothetical protein
VLGACAPGAAACTVRWQSASSQRLLGETQGFNAVTVVDRSLAWAVGSRVGAGNRERPATLRWDGRRWTSVPNPFGRGELSDVIAFGPREVWAVGEENGSALVARWDGSRWHRERAPRTNGGVFQIASGIEGRLWLAHPRGVYDWTARRWLFRVPQPQELEGVSFRSPVDAWAWAVADRRPDRFGLRGYAVYRSRGGGWRRVQVPARVFRDVAFDGGRAWAVGRSQSRNVLLRWRGRWRRVPGVEDPVGVFVAPGGPAYVLRRGNPWHVGRLGGPEATVPLNDRDAIFNFEVRDGVVAVVTPSRLLVGRLAC